jgi:hypothetical protein
MLPSGDQHMRHALAAATVLAATLAAPNLASAQGACVVRGSPNHVVAVYDRPGGVQVGSLGGGSAVTSVGRIHVGQQLWVRLGKQDFSGILGVVPARALACGPGTG